MNSVSKAQNRFRDLTKPNVATQNRNLTSKERALCSDELKTITRKSNLNDGVLKNSQCRKCKSRLHGNLICNHNSNQAQTSLPTVPEKGKCFEHKQSFCADHTIVEVLVRGKSKGHNETIPGHDLHRVCKSMPYEEKKNNISINMQSSNPSSKQCVVVSEKPVKLGAVHNVSTINSVKKQNSTNIVTTVQSPPTRNQSWGHILQEQNADSQNAAPKTPSIRDRCEQIEQGISRLKMPSLNASRVGSCISPSQFSRAIHSPTGSPTEETTKPSDVVFENARPAGTHSFATPKSEETVIVIDRSVQCSHSGFGSTNSNNEFYQKQCLFGDKNGAFSIFNPVRTLNFLIKELRGKVSKDGDETLQRILVDMEEAVVRLPPSSHVSGRSPRKSSDELSHVPQRLHDTVNGVLEPVHEEWPCSIPKSVKESDPTGTECAVGRTESVGLQRKLENSCVLLQKTCQQMEACANLKNELSRISCELADKNKLVDLLVAKEADYERHIDDLKRRVDRLTVGADHNGRAMQELTQRLSKLQQENQALGGIQEMNANLNWRLLEANRENEKLSDELKLMELGQEKLNILIGLKDDKIRNMKEDVNAIRSLVCNGLLKMGGDASERVAVISSDTVLETSTSVVSTDPNERGDTPARPVSSSLLSSLLTPEGCCDSWQRISEIQSTPPSGKTDDLLEYQSAGTQEEKRKMFQWMFAEMRRTSRLGTNNSFASPHVKSLKQDILDRSGMSAWSDEILTDDLRTYSLSDSE